MIGCKKNKFTFLCLVISIFNITCITCITLYFNIYMKITSIVLIIVSISIIISNSFAIQCF